MKKILYLPLIIMALCGFDTTNAQTLSIGLLPGKAKKTLQHYVFLESGTYTGGLAMGSDSLQWPLPERRSIKSFYMNRFEVSVGDYQEFVRDVGNPKSHYDSTVWTKDYPYSFNEPMARNYLWHPNFFQYPVVGITWNQAVEYCNWKTEQLNGLLENSPYRVMVRLPSETEWEYAALFTIPSHRSSTKDEHIKDHRMYPWDGLFLLPKQDGQFYTNCNSGLLKTIDGVTVMGYVSDGFLYTAPVKSFQPNEAGLYQMAGNVAEWTTDNYSIKLNQYNTLLDELEDGQKASYPELLDKLRSLVSNTRYSELKIIKGGSWVDGPFYMQTGSFKIQAPEKATSTTGFRTVLIVERK